MMSNLQKKCLRFTLTTPILYLAFNRLDFVKKTFPVIQKAKPKQLFIACDGPRSKEEKKKTDAVRKYIVDHLDWECKVKTLFRDKNLGCRDASNGAIDWFFKNVEYGIILEDDTVYSRTYLRFMQEMLKKYRNNEKIMSISGHNRVGHINTKDSYYFSQNFGCWGWATWKRSWNKQDLYLTNYLKIKKEGKLNEYFPNIIERILWSKRVKDILDENISSWAYCFYMSHILNNGLCISPKVNLVENIGFVEDSTHTKNNEIDIKFLKTPLKEISFPLLYPSEININHQAAKKWLLIDIKRLILKKIFFWKAK